VTVALSGDGGDEAFGGYQLYWQIARIARMQSLPASILRSAAVVLGGAARWGFVPGRLPQRVGELASADDIAIIQSLLCWVRGEEQGRLCLDEGKALPIRRLFEPQWKHEFAARAARLERLSAYATEANVRLVLPNDFLFKVDTASMKESLEIRVPMLDEDLFEFGLSLPHRLKVQGRTCKRVLRAVADRWLPPRVARKAKMGFGIPVDRWVDFAFKMRLKETLLGPSCRLPEYFRPETYRPMVEAFCHGKPCPGISREGLYRRAIMFLSLHLALGDKGSL
jgi:asparagine synthase (glutamine-hydrolysing)